MRATSRVWNWGRHRRWLNGSAIALVMMLFCHRPAAAESPWMDINSGDNFIFFGKSVWDVNTGQKISDAGAPLTWMGPETRRVAGVNDRVWQPGLDRTSPGMSPVGVLAPLNGGGKIFTLDGKPQVDSNNASNFWVADDRRRIVWVQNGDFWRGEIDWGQNTVVNRKQVTSVGAFNNASSPLLWWGNVLLVYGNFDKDKPVVRIDLLTGSTEEIETYHVIENNPGRNVALVSPSHCRIIKWSPSAIYSYDVRTNQPTVIANSFESEQHTSSMDFTAQFPPVWTDDETAYCLTINGYLVRLDFRNAAMEVLARPQSVVTKVQSILPGEKFADLVDSTGGGQSGPSMFKERYLLELQTAQRTALPFDDKCYGLWLDDAKYLYVREKGGLSSVGIWLYNLADGSNKRLGGGTIDTQRAMYLPKQNQVWAVSQQSGVTLRKINLDGSGIVDLGPCALAIPTRMPTETIDLGLSGTVADLWKPIAVDTTALVPTQPKPQPKPQKESSPQKPAPPQDQPQQEDSVQTQVNQAADKAQKGKNTVNKLKGIFGQ